MTQKNLTQTSKFLSLILRHKPETIGLNLNQHGWADISELIEKAPSEMSLTIALIKQIVAENNKKRFALSDDGLQIRANQGHSISVDLGFTCSEPPSLLFHGTASRFITAIKAEGLIAGQRHHVHLSTNIKTALSVGKRYGKPVILQVAAKEMYQQGHRFFLSENNVWLTDAVPPQFLSEH